MLKLILLTSNIFRIFLPALKRQIFSKTMAYSFGKYADLHIKMMAYELE